MISMNNLAQDIHNPDLKTGAEIKGYKIKSIAVLKEIDAFYYELIHQKTGARHVHISRNDVENTFSVAFKTVPSDSTGVAHILEHTVLCGSTKFPLRDPFFSMLKRSLSTFMNAFTASDWTMYPFSTQNQKDFYNLMDVYLDAVFYPIIDELSFKQEGHRLEVESNDGDLNLVYKGVVYNEMKGAMSSPDQIMGRSLLKALYPDTTYSNNSGGDPAVIPKLTYAQLKAFHQRHYHPSNAFFYTYGNLPLRSHLAFISEKILNHFQKIDPKTEVPPQPRWDTPRTFQQPYPFSKNENPEKKYQICLAWLTADIQDSLQVLALNVLEQILLANAASPLRKALIDSGLGTSLSDGSGYDGENRDTMFCCGLKDVKADDAPKIEALILNVFKALIQEGIESELIESALHQIEFHRKEITNTPYPFGLKLFLTFGGSWFHGGRPENILNFNDDVVKLRQELAEGPYLEGCIQRYFLDNPHRILFTLIPDQQMEERENERVRSELETTKKNLSPEALDRIQKEAQVLRERQEAVEDVSKLPTLALEDIPPNVVCIHPTPGFAPTVASSYDQGTSGIFYFSAAAGAGGIRPELLPMVSFFCHAFTKMGTSKRNYLELARKIDRYSGGLGASTQTRTKFDQQNSSLALVTLNGKCLNSNQEKLFELILELTSQSKFSDLKRLKQILWEYRAAMESMIVHNGHRLAISLASRNFSATNMLNEIWGGTLQLKTIKTLTDGLTDDDLNTLTAQLAQIADILFYQGNLKMALIGDHMSVKKAVKATENLKVALKESGPPGFKSPLVSIKDEPPREGWCTTTAVSFVAQTFKTVRINHEDAPSLAVLSKILRSLYLHREIREKGGAYGGFAIYTGEDGLFSFASYRDPHIVNTLKVYDNAVDFIRSSNYTEEDVKEAVLQVCSEIDKPDPPGPAARKAFYRSLIQLSDEVRIAFKQKLLKLRRQTVIEVAEKYFTKGSRDKAVVVISNPDKLKTANQKLSDRPLTIHTI
jgi:Zn-dependent M16 (insulinase) family peptidase